MQSLETLNKRDIVALAKRGDPEAIAHIMNYHFQPKKMTVNVTYADQHFLILVEASSVPKQADVVPPINRALKRLHLKNVKGIRIFGRKEGTVAADWLKQIEITSSDSCSTGLALVDWLSQGESQEKSAFLVPQNTNLSRSEHVSRFLNVYYSLNEIAAIDLSSILEVIQVSVYDILPIPQMPEPILGIYNYRGKILTLIDLAQKLEKPSFLLQDHIHSLKNSHLFSLVVQHENKMLGFVIPQIIDIQLYDQAEIGKPDPAIFPSSMMPLISGYFKSNIVPILDIGALCI